jgi:protein-S-isoprenylcysteine O-methyltransferase Ste14
MEAKLLLIPWMASVLYSSVPLFWFVVHPFAGSWRRMGRSPYRVVLPVWAALIILLGWITWHWHGVQLYSLVWMWAPAAVLLLLGLSMYARVRSSFSPHKLSGEAELCPEEHAQELVSTGLHSRMRHPIYIAHLTNFLGWAVGSGLLVSYVLLAISILLTFPLMIWLEERELASRFGAQFREYRRLSFRSCSRGLRERGWRDFVPPLRGSNRFGILPRPYGLGQAVLRLRRWSLRFIYGARAA